MEHKIKTFEDALALSGTEKEKAFFANKELLAQLEPDEIAYKKLKVIHRALNTAESGEVKKTNWNDGSWKYFPWLEVEASEEQPAGVGFSNAYCANAFSHSTVGSRLCNNISSDLAIYAGKQFAQEYKEFWLE